MSFGKKANEIIKKYLNAGEYKGKAGAYGIQGYGENLVDKYVGCYNNVNGRPINKLNQVLKDKFNIELL